MNIHHASSSVRSNQPGRRARRRGTVLLTVTVVVMLISLAAFGFATRMQTEHKAALATADQLQARAAARSGVALGAAVGLQMLLDRRLHHPPDPTRLGWR